METWKKVKSMAKHKATVETLVDTAATTLLSFGVFNILQRDYYGFIVVAFGILLEFFKYWGRFKKFW